MKMTITLTTDDKSHIFGAETEIVDLSESGIEIAARDLAPLLTTELKAIL